MREAMFGGLKVRVVGEKAGAEGPVVVLLHGFGAPGTDLVPLAGEIAAPAGTRWVFPEAPHLLPAALGGGVGRAWWMIDVMRFQLAALTGQVAGLIREVPEGLAEAREQVIAMLAELEQDLGFRRESLVLGGFSQGAMLACDVALHMDTPLAGLVLMSGSIVAEEVWAERMERREDLPVLQSHGRDDPLLPFAIAEQLRDRLVGAGMQVTWVPFDGGHGVAPIVLDAFSDFLGQL
ncbi:MAG: phospholipase [Myxococcales bacterium]|nr:phospholipase [Myxococcales bacterium]